MKNYNLIYNSIKPINHKLYIYGGTHFKVSRNSFFSGTPQRERHKNPLPNKNWSWSYSDYRDFLEKIEPRPGSLKVHEDLVPGYGFFCVPLTPENCGDFLDKITKHQIGESIPFYVTKEGHAHCKPMKGAVKESKVEFFLKWDLGKVRALLEDQCIVYSDYGSIENVTDTKLRTELGDFNEKLFYNMQITRWPVRDRVPSLTDLERKSQDTLKSYQFRPFDFLYWPGPIRMLKRRFRPEYGGHDVRPGYNCPFNACRHAGGMGPLMDPHFLFAGYLKGNYPGLERVRFSSLELEKVIAEVNVLRAKIEAYCNAQIETEPGATGTPQPAGYTNKSDAVVAFIYGARVEKELNLTIPERNGLEECVGIMIEYWTMHLGGYANSTFGVESNPFWGSHHSLEQLRSHCYHESRAKESRRVIAVLDLEMGMGKRPFMLLLTRLLKQRGRCSGFTIPDSMKGFSPTRNNHRMPSPNYNHLYCLVTGLAASEIDGSELPEDSRFWTLHHKRQAFTMRLINSLLAAAAVREINRRFYSLDCPSFAHIPVEVVHGQLVLTEVLPLVDGKPTRRGKLEGGLLPSLKHWFHTLTGYKAKLTSKVVRAKHTRMPKEEADKNVRFLTYRLDSQPKHIALYSDVTEFQEVLELLGYLKANSSMGPKGIVNESMLIYLPEVIQLHYLRIMQDICELSYLAKYPKHKDSSAPYEYFHSSLRDSYLLTLEAWEPKNRSPEESRYGLESLKSPLVRSFPSLQEVEEYVGQLRVFSKYSRQRKKGNMTDYSFYMNKTCSFPSFDAWYRSRKIVPIRYPDWMHDKNFIIFYTKLLVNAGVVDSKHCFPYSDYGLPRVTPVSREEARRIVHKEWWKNWPDAHFELIKKAFEAELNLASKRELSNMVEALWRNQKEK